MPGVDTRRHPAGEAPKCPCLLCVSVQVHVEFRPKRQDDRPVALQDGATAADLIRAVGEPVHVIVAVRDGSPIPEDEVLRDGETILLLSAASGG